MDEAELAGASYDRKPTTSYADMLQGMSDEVLLEELRSTCDHLRAASLDADVDVVAEVARRWRG